MGSLAQRVGHGGPALSGVLQGVGLVRRVGAGVIGEAGAAADLLIQRVQLRREIGFVVAGAQLRQTVQQRLLGLHVAGGGIALFQPIQRGGGAVGYLAQRQVGGRTGLAGAAAGVAAAVAAAAAVLAQQAAPCLRARDAVQLQVVPFLIVPDGGAGFFTEDAVHGQAVAVLIQDRLQFRDGAAGGAEAHLTVSRCHRKTS